MFDLLVDLGARLHITNRQGLTPLTLAAKLARKEVSAKFRKGVDVHIFFKYGCHFVQVRMSFSVGMVMRCCLDQ